MSAARDSLQHVNSLTADLETTVSAIREELLQETPRFEAVRHLALLAKDLAPQLLAAADRHMEQAQMAQKNEEELR